MLVSSERSWTAAPNPLRESLTSRTDELPFRRGRQVAPRPVGSEVAREGLDEQRPGRTDGAAGRVVPSSSERAFGFGWCRWVRVQLRSPRSRPRQKKKRSTEPQLADIPPPSLPTATPSSKSNATELAQHA